MNRAPAHHSPYKGQTVKPPYVSFGIAARLYGVVAIAAACLVGISVFAFQELGTVERDADRIGAQRVPQMRRAAVLDLDVTRISLQLRHAMLVRAPDALAGTIADIARLRQQAGDTLAAYGQAALTDASRQRSAALAGQGADFWGLAPRNLALVQTSQRAEAFDFLVERTIPARNAVLAELGPRGTSASCCGGAWRRRRRQPSACVTATSRSRCWTTPATSSARCSRSCRTR